MGTRLDQITPNCRYGHGDLRKLDTVFGGEWGLISSTSGLDVLFTGHLYVCPSCGYTELFDPDPQKTARGEITLPPLGVTGKAKNDAT